MKNLLLQVNVERKTNNKVANKTFRYNSDLYHLSAKQAMKYANVCNADYIQITDCSFLPDKHPVYQKLNMFRFTDYDQILYVDSDAIILNNIPNIFDLYTNCDFSATIDIDTNTNSQHALKLSKQRNKRYGATFDYNSFCSGVMLVNKRFIDRNINNWQQYVDSFDQGGMQDQGIFNRLVIDEGGQYNVLHSDWGAWYKQGKYIVHVAGHKKNHFNIDKFCNRHKL